MKKRVLTLVLSLVVIVASIPGTGMVSAGAEPVEDVTVIDAAADASGEVTGETEQETPEENPDQENPEQESEQTGTVMPVMPDFRKEEYNRQIEETAALINGSADAACEINAEAATATYAAKYDPRTTGKVTSVKNQGEWGLCWDYAALAAIESELIHQGFETSTVDLSELHLAYFYYKEYASGKTFTSFCENGATASKCANILAGGVGPVRESTVPMVAITDETTVPENLKYSHIYEIKSMAVEQLGSTPDEINNVKNLITTYGAASMSYYHVDSNWKYELFGEGDTAYYMSTDIPLTNHAVELVGWDDNYAASNFVNTPPGNGAWLVKNSWGTGDANLRTGSGFMWISYYDGSIDGNDIYSFSFQPNGTNPTSITFEQSEYIITKGNSVKLNTTVLPSTARQDVIYLSDNEKVATVDETGKVTGVGKGSCNITCRMNFSYDGVRAVCKVTVNENEVKLEADRLSLTKGSTGQVCASLKYASDYDQTFLYRSLSPAVATVDETGKVTAVGYGEAEIMVSTTDSSTIPATLKVNVYTASIHADDIAAQYPSEWGNDYVVHVYMDDREYELSSIVFPYTALSGNQSIVSDGRQSPGYGDTTVTVCGTGETVLNISYTDEVFTNGKTLTTTCKVTVTGPQQATIPDDVEDTTGNTNSNGTFSDDKSGKDSEKNDAAKPTGKIVIGSSAYCFMDDEVSYAGTRGNKAETITVPSHVEYEGKSYKVTRIASGAFRNVRTMKKVVIPDTVMEIASNAFCGCANLTEVSMSKNVTYIGKNAFKNCKKLKKISLPKNLTEIGDNAFQNCRKLTSVTVPAKVKQIGKAAFYKCSSLKKVTIKSNVLKKVGAKAFTGINKKATIKVPKKKLKSYTKLLKGKYSKGMKIAK